MEKQNAQQGTRKEWLEIENDACFEGKEGVLYTTVLLFTRCIQLKRGIRRIEDVVEFKGATRDDCDQQVARFCERADVQLMPSIVEAMREA